MSLNCRPGDLAVVIASFGGKNLGRIVRCTRLHTSKTHDVDGVRLVTIRRGPRWVIEPVLRNIDGCPLYSYADAALRPIRDSDEPDQTLEWAGKPESAAIKWALGVTGGAA